MKKKTLHLNVKKKWFDMILSGEKTEEYRDIKESWIRRLFDFSDADFIVDLIDDLADTAPDCYSAESVFMFFDFQFKEFDTVTFSNGMKTKDKVPRFEIELKSIDVDFGIEKWGAVSGEKYFVIKVGEIINRQNC